VGCGSGAETWVSSREQGTVPYVSIDVRGREMAKGRPPWQGEGQRKERLKMDEICREKAVDERLCKHSSGVRLSSMVTGHSGG
jgi:hypothetical protein